MNKIYKVLLVVLIFLSAVLFYMNVKSPVKVALIGNFEEERYSFATSSIIAGRIAEKSINDSLGIKGKNTELIVKDDDFKNPEDIVAFLKKNKIQAIITTAASNNLLNLKPHLDENKILCISVGATSENLSKQDDSIYKILPNDEEEIKTFLKHLDKDKIEKNIALIYDKSNLEYKQSIEGAIEKLGGKVVFQEGWDKDSVSYTPSNIEAIKDKPILILSTARHTAFIVQKLKSYGIKDKIFGTSWSGDDYLLSYGGRAVEGFIFTTSVDFSNEDKDTLELSKNLKEYEKNNGLIPNGVSKAYNIIRKVFEYKYEQHSTLKEAIDRSGFFDVYGDSKEKEMVFTIKNGQFVKLGE
jgi:branched-chain amino acid transport system substrate-binding protein